MWLLAVLGARVGGNLMFSPAEGRGVEPSVGLGGGYLNSLSVRFVEFQGAKHCNMPMKTRFLKNCAK